MSCTWRTVLTTTPTKASHSDSHWHPTSTTRKLLPVWKGILEMGWGDGTQKQSDNVRYICFFLSWSHLNSLKFGLFPCATNWRADHFLGMIWKLPICCAFVVYIRFIHARLNYILYCGTVKHFIVLQIFSQVFGFLCWVEKNMFFFSSLLMIFLKACFGKAVTLFNTL